MTENINAYCKICGNGYHVCNSCLEQKTFKPWRAITDSIEHYKIFLAIHGYTISKNKDKAKEDLSNCDLSELDNFLPEIKSVIEEIMADTKKKRLASRVKKVDTNEELSIKEKIINNE